MSVDLELKKILENPYYPDKYIPCSRRYLPLFLKKDNLYSLEWRWARDDSSFLGAAEIIAERILLMQDKSKSGASILSSIDLSNAVRNLKKIKQIMITITDSTTVKRKIQIQMDKAIQALEPNYLTLDAIFNRRTLLVIGTSFALGVLATLAVR